MTTWVTAAGPVTTDGDSTGWTTYTIRQVIASAQISNTGLGLVRVTFGAAAGQGFTIGSAYIQHAAASGDAYDFIATPKQLYFSGTAGVAISAAGTATSDLARFVLEPSKNLVISLYVSGDATHDDACRRAAQTGWTSYYKSGNDAATVNATGYSSGATATIAVTKVEAARLWTPKIEIF